jgi:hypothetical protein
MRFIASSAVVADAPYITGDMVGEGSPAAVYATLCGTR